ncbi:MAG: hypothetical protein JSS86_25830, partial [Cyanobacteria bacterium SZAS LIN-2]|nr:hypothetical protein [Cyanobacteria bacterium SZAS LIN-2]
MTDRPENTRENGAKASPPDVGLNLSADQIFKLPQKSSLETTLFDLAKHSLNERSKVSGEATDKNNVYHELNRIMVLNHYNAANIAARANISDRDLPRSWNNVKAHQEFKLYDSSPQKSGAGADKASIDQAALRDKLRRQIEEETSTVPVQPGEGYYQVWERMHPELKPERVNEDAHRIKHINGNRDVLKVGERLATATEEERNRELEKRIKAAQPPVDSKAPPVDSKTPPVAPKTPPADTKAPPASTPAGPDFNAVYSSLLQQHEQAVRLQNEAEKNQGVIGRTFDGAKTHIGTSGKDQPWYSPGRVWSGLFDKDLSSAAIDKRLHDEGEKLDHLKQAAEAKDPTKFATTYKEITGKDFNPTDKSAVVLDGTAATKSFDQSQHNGVDAISDIAVALAVAATLRSGKGNLTQTLLRAEGTGIVVGGVSKAALMQLDGRYADIRHDLAVGSLMGATVPLGELGGAQLSRVLGGKIGATVTGDLLTARIETQGSTIGTKLLSAAAKSGTSGAIFGAIESPGRETINDLEQGREIKVSHLVSTSIKGSVFGFLGGTILGAGVDGVGNGFRSLRPAPLSTVKNTVAGV